MMLLARLYIMSCLKTSILLILVNLVTKKIVILRSKILQIKYLVLLSYSAAVTAVENKIPNISNQVKKEDYVEKIKETEGKYFTTYDYNKITNNILDAKIKNKILVNRSDISGIIHNTDLDEEKKS